MSMNPLKDSMIWYSNFWDMVKMLSRLDYTPACNICVETKTCRWWVKLRTYTIHILNDCVVVGLPTMRLIKARHTDTHASLLDSLQYNWCSGETITFWFNSARDMTSILFSQVSIADRERNIQIFPAYRSVDNHSAQSYRNELFYPQCASPQGPNLSLSL